MKFCNSEKDTKAYMQMLDGRLLDSNSKENIHRLVGAALVRLKVNSKVP